MRGQIVELGENHAALAREDQRTHIGEAAHVGFVVPGRRDEFRKRAVALRAHMTMDARRCGQRGDFLRAFALEAGAAVENQALRRCALVGHCVVIRQTAVFSNWRRRAGDSAQIPRVPACAGCPA